MSRESIDKSGLFSDNKEIETPSVKSEDENVESTRR